MWNINLCDQSYLKLAVSLASTNSFCGEFCIYRCDLLLENTVILFVIRWGNLLKLPRKLRRLK